MRIRVEYLEICEFQSLSPPAESLPRSNHSASTLLTESDKTGPPYFRIRAVERWRGKRQFHTRARPLTFPQMPAKPAQPQRLPKPTRKRNRRRLATAWTFAPLDSKRWAPLAAGPAHSSTTSLPGSARGEVQPGREHPSIDKSPPLFSSATRRAYSRLTLAVAEREGPRTIFRILTNSIIILHLH